MDKDKGFKSIEELVRSLAGKVGELSVGSAKVQDIERMCEESRELYERLVVLRHRGREALLEGQETIDLKVESVENGSEQETEEKAAELPVMTLDFGNAEEEVIEEEEKDQEEEPEDPRKQESIQFTVSLSDQEVQTTVEEEPAVETEPAPATAPAVELPDLGSSIGLNQKFMFISQIFNGKKDEYASAIDELGTVTELGKALEIGKRFTAHLSDEEDEGEAKKQFLDLIERRFA